LQGAALDEPALAERADGADGFVVAVAVQLDIDVTTHIEVAQCPVARGFAQRRVDRGAGPIVPSASPALAARFGRC
jgi:hypothetical protein